MKSSYWEGKAVRLRGLEPEDWQSFYNWNQESDTQRYLDRIWFPGSQEMVRDWAKTQSQQKGEKDEFFFVIEEKESGQIAGSINTHDCDKTNGNFSYGVGIMPAMRRKGYAKEAIRMMLGYFFEELRYEKATVGIYSHNESSIRLHEQLGFLLEGRIRSMIFQQGQFWDLVKMGMLGGEFRKKFG